MCIFRINLEEIAKFLTNQEREYKFISIKHTIQCQYSAKESEVQEMVVSDILQSDGDGVIGWNSAKEFRLISKGEEVTVWH